MLLENLCKQLKFQNEWYYWAYSPVIKRAYKKDQFLPQNEF